LIPTPTKLFCPKIARSHHAEVGDSEFPSFVQLTPVADVSTKFTPPLVLNVPLPYATPYNSAPVPLVCCVHAPPSGDVKIDPLAPTATYVPLPYATPVSNPEKLFGENRCVHVFPSSEVMITPFTPTVTNFPFAKIICDARKVTPVLCDVHTVPFVDVSATPPSPIATNVPFPYVTHVKFGLNAGLTRFHVTPLFVDNASVPSPATATNRPSPYATSCSGAVIGDVRDVHFTCAKTCPPANPHASNTHTHQRPRPLKIRVIPHPTKNPPQRQTVWGIN
jgi:hypothetical protein